MKLTEIYKRFKTISAYYGGQPPMSVLIGITGLSKEETVSIWKEYVDGLPPDQKPGVKKRGPKPKAPVKRLRTKKTPVVNEPDITVNVTAPQLAPNEIKKILDDTKSRSIPDSHTHTEPVPQ